MSKKITPADYLQMSKEYGLTVADIKTIVAVESGGKGFDDETGKIIIQFEPAWFKKKAPFTPSGKWSLNGVERQAREWECFNDAFSKNPLAALLSTSVGLMQVMGFNHVTCGFKTPGAFWDFAKESEANQIRLGLNFIKANKKMFRALQAHDWDTFAFYYNGPKYKKFNYADRLEAAYKIHSK